MGPLKKRYAQLWFVKYVEIRKGNLTYYDDSKNEESGRRKTIHLRKRTCTCQAVATKDGYVFELIIEGHPKRLWMAKSEEERQGWIRAINQAVIGETDDSRDVPLDLTPYQNAIDVYQSVQSSLQEVKTRKDYTVAVDSLLYRQRSSSALRLPMKWILEQVVKDEEDEKEPDAPHERVRSNISDFWKSLCSTSVSINGFLVEANSVYSGERVIGALSRCILEFDKNENDEMYQEVGGVLNSTKQRHADSFVTEVEAASYARTILTGILRSKVRGDVYSALEKLVRNDVARVKLESSEPLHIDVSFAGDDFSEQEPQPYDVTGWVPTRLKKNRTWKERYFVISEGVLSFYQNADPRPYGLRGQLVLRDAEVKIVDENIIQIQTKDQERQLRFDDRGEFVKWKAIIERAADPQGSVDISSAVAQDVSRQRKKKTYMTEAGVKLFKGATGGGKIAMKAMLGAKDAGMKSIKSAGGILARGIRGAPKNGQSSGGERRRPTTDMFMTSTMNLQSKSGKREPTVQVLVELNSIFKVVSNESSSEEEDWL
jgi:hypothetical protein